MRTKLLLLLLLLVCAFPAKPTLHPIAEITGTGAAVAISTDSSSRPAWVQVIAPAGNSAVVRFGDSTTSATMGLPIAAGGGYNTPVCSSCVYTLSTLYVYVANGDKADVAWGN